MKKQFIIGVDVSKATLDLYVHGSNKSLNTSNNQTGFKEILRWIKKEVSKELSECMLVMEYTGVYTLKLEFFLFEHLLSYVKRPALDILRSVGMKRGKTDKADARMISQYGWYRNGDLIPMAPPSDTQLKLSQLMSYRDKLVADRASISTRLRELKDALSRSLPDIVIKSSERLIKVLDEQISQIESEILSLISANIGLYTNYKLLISIKGIAFVNAVHLLLVTENFTRFTDPRKFACYAGIAPFPHKSGSSIKGKTRVSHLANKKIKSLLSSAACSAIQWDPELKAKYHKKIEEGKHEMSAKNMIKFKLIERIFAVIRRQTPYVVNRQAA